MISCISFSSTLQDFTICPKDILNTDDVKCQKSHDLAMPVTKVVRRLKQFLHMKMLATWLSLVEIEFNAIQHLLEIA